MSKLRKLMSNSGFTLVEMLIAVGIIVVLVAVGAVALQRQRMDLKITELDNKARDIWMAAQNRAVLLQSDGRMGEQLADGGAMQYYDNAGEELHFVEWGTSNSSDIMNELLPSGSIDPTLRNNGQFYIVYNLAVGCVTDVFYVDNRETAIPSIDDAFALVTAGREKRKFNKPMVGYYGNDGEVNEDISTHPLAAACSEVSIENGNELTVKVKFSIPSDLPGDVQYIPSVELLYGGNKKTLLKMEDTGVELWGGADNCRLTVSDHSAFTSVWSDTSVTYTWVLDSLDFTDSYNRQFKTIGVGNPGGDFTIVAGLRLSASGYIDSAHFVEESDNSIFARSSHDSVARVENLRHLQNLNVSFSGVAGITSAEQLRDIDCKTSYRNNGTVLNANYEFVPIVNTSLLSYDGRKKEITNLSTISSGSYAGLFGTFIKTGSEPCSIKGVRLADATVQATQAAGALIGKAVDIDISDCYVYCPDSDSLKVEDGVEYRVIASIVGGLVGDMTGGSVKDSFAATTVEGDGYAGGLSGKMSGTDVSGSYADCYIHTKANGARAGGLFGSGTGRVTTCYAAGFILEDSDKTVKSAGLANGVLTAKDSYSIVRSLKLDGDTVTVDIPATQLHGSFTSEDDTTNRVYYIYRSADSIVPSGLAAWDKSSSIGVETHTYDIAHSLSDDIKSIDGEVYPYPFISGLPHWSDWAELDSVSASIVYYEVYGDKLSLSEAGTNYGIYSTEESTLKDSERIRIDGYALVLDKLLTVDAKAGILFNYGDNTEWLLREASQSHISIKIKDVTDWEWYSKTESMSYGPAEVLMQDDSLLVVLPNAITTGVPANTNRFWQYATVGLDGDDVLWFNPHFAKSVTTVEEGTPEEPVASGVAPISVRTPRHLRNVWNFGEDYSAGAYRYLQEFDLDFGFTAWNWHSYVWYGADSSVAYAHGGDVFMLNNTNSDIAFNGSYNGNYHTIRGIFSVGRSDASYSGLFGATTSNALLSNIVYEFDPALDLVSNSQGVGTLVGWNSGTVKNCAVYGVNLSTTDNTVYMGGLSGDNDGTVENCSVEVVNLKANGSQIVSGISGISSGNIKDSYVVGKISGSGSSTLYGIANSGTTTGSYAAVYLEGGNARYGAGGNGGTFVNGIFRYRDDVYDVSTLGYSDMSKAVGWTSSYKDRKSDWTNSVRDMIDGCKYNTFYEESHRSFNLVAKVKDSSGSYIHHGLWPIAVDTGLAYYERYGGNNSHNYSFRGYDARYTVVGDNLMSDGAYDSTRTHIFDGYAMVVPYEYNEGIASGTMKLAEGLEYTVRYEGNIWTLTLDDSGEGIWSCGSVTSAISPEYHANGDMTGYFIYQLPAEIVMGTLPNRSNYYQKLSVGADTFGFNPHFGDTVYSGKDVPTGALTGQNLNVRTARHLYALSYFKHDEDLIYAATVCSYKYSQSMDINYCTYDWDAMGEDCEEMGYSPIRATTRKGETYYLQPMICDPAQVSTQALIQPGVRGKWPYTDPGHVTFDNFMGEYYGTGHDLRGVSFAVPEGRLMYIGLFGYNEMISGVNYYVPDGIEIVLHNDCYWDRDGFKDGVFVGLLSGGGFVMSECNIYMGDVKVTSEVGSSQWGSPRVYVGSLAGYCNNMARFMQEKPCSGYITGSFDVSGDGVLLVGGLFGMVKNSIAYHSLYMSESAVLSAEARLDCYVGGIAGQISANTGWGPMANPNVIAHCTVDAGTIRAVSTGGGHLYCGGAIGWSDGGFANNVTVRKFDVQSTAYGGISTCIGGVFGGGTEIGAYQGVLSLSGGQNIASIGEIEVECNNDLNIGGVAGLVRYRPKDIGRSSADSSSNNAYNKADYYQPKKVGVLDSNVAWLDTKSIKITGNCNPFVGGIAGYGASGSSYAGPLNITNFGNTLIKSGDTVLAEGNYAKVDWSYLNGLVDYDGSNLKTGIYFGNY